MARSAQRVIAVAALSAHPVQRAFVAGLLWGDSPEGRASGNLRSAIWRLQQQGIDVLTFDGDTIRLADHISTDVRDLMDWAHLLSTSNERPLDDDALGQLIAFGELLPDWYEEWVAPQRERMHQLRLHVLEACSVALSATNRHTRAVDLALAALAGDPLRESANRALIGAYLAEGNVSDARRQYYSYRELLEQELGLQPSELMDDLLAQMAPAAPSA